MWCKSCTLQLDWSLIHHQPNNHPQEQKISYVKYLFVFQRKTVKITPQVIMVIISAQAETSFMFKSRAATKDYFYQLMD